MRIDVHCSSVQKAMEIARERGMPVVAQVGKDVIVVDESGRYRVDFQG